MIVKVEDIIIDNVMVNTLTYLKPCINLSKYKIERGDVVGNKLNRMKNIENYFERVFISPIKLEALRLYIPPQKRFAQNQMFYKIIDGRHRICYCILNNIEEIEATII